MLKTPYLDTIVIEPNHYPAFGYSAITVSGASTSHVRIKSDFAPKYPAQRI
jgi:hypothetical protein